VILRRANPDDVPALGYVEDGRHIDDRSQRVYMSKRVG